MARHLSTTQLASWLSGEVDHGEYEEHLDSCVQCAARLEEISDETNTNNVHAISAEFRPALLTLLQPPADLHQRISARIAARLQDQNDASLIGSMLGVSIETARIVTEPNLNED